MTTPDERIITVYQSDRNRGRIDRSRLGQKHPDDTEERIVLSPEDIEATQQELKAYRSRMKPTAEQIVRADLSNPNRGRINRERFENPNPNDTEERPVISREDYEATLKEGRELRRRMTPKAS
jgi:hypothetical protein